MRKAVFAILAAASAISMIGCVTVDKFVQTEEVQVKSTSGKEGDKLQTAIVQRRAEQNVIEKSTNVKSVTKVTSFDREKDKNRQVATFGFSPDGEFLVYSLFEASENVWFSQLWRSPRNGGAMTKVTNGQYFDLNPVYTADGDYIYFSSNRNDPMTKIWRIKSSGAGGLTKITTGSSWDSSPAISKDGKSISYTSSNFADSEPQIWVSEIGGQLPTQLTYGTQPRFSGEGGMIIFSAKPEGQDAKAADSKKDERDLWTMRTDGTMRTQVTQAHAICMDASWSPDGKYIVYASNEAKDETGQPNFDIYMMKADGTEKTQLTTNGSHDDMPTFEPKGKYIYFRSNRGGSWNIWRMELTY